MANLGPLPPNDHDVHEEKYDEDSQQRTDSEFGGTKARKELERKLLWKIDLRMSILVVIYILNFVSSFQGLSDCIT